MSEAFELGRLQVAVDFHLAALGGEGVFSPGATERRLREIRDEQRAAQEADRVG